MKPALTRITCIMNIKFTKIFLKITEIYTQVAVPCDVMVS